MSINRIYLHARVRSVGSLVVSATILLKFFKRDFILKTVLFPQIKPLISVQSVTSAACGGLTVLTGQMRASGSQLRLCLRGDG